MSESDAESQAQRLQLAAEAIADLSDANADYLASIVEQARLSGQTPQEAAVDAAAYLDQPDPIPDAGPTPADMRGEVDHERA
jgi:hypothetical protein